MTAWGAALTMAGSMILTGCGGAMLPILAGISAAGSVASAAQSLYQVGGDILAATAIACRELPGAEAAEQRKVTFGTLPAAAMMTPWVRALCDDLRPGNPNLDVGSPAWVAGIVGKQSP